MRAERGRWSAAGPAGAGCAVVAALLLGGPAFGQEAPAAPAAEDTAIVDTTIADTAPEAPAPSPARRAASDRVSVFGGSQTIAAGEVVRDAVVLGGTLHVHGEITGDAVVLGGHLVHYDGSLIRGDVVVLGGRVRDEGGSVRGQTVEGISVRGPRVIRPDAPATTRSPWRRVTRGLAGIASIGGLLLVLGGIGAVLVFYGRRYLDTVSDTVRAAPIRSGGAGLATGFLILPAFVFMILALTLSIIGIPLLLAAIPLYLLAVPVAVGFGLLGACHALGERTVEQQGAPAARYRNSFAYLFLGLAILFAPVVAGYLIGMTPFLGFVGGTLRFLGWVAIWVAATMGLGAVVLSRAGTRRTFVEGRTPPASDPILEDEPV